MENILGKFFRLLEEAFEASENVDGYDLDSADAEDILIFNSAIQDQEQTSVALIDYVLNNEKEIKYLLSIYKKEGV